MNRFSKRSSRQESILIKNQQQNILEIDENIQTNGHEISENKIDEIDNENAIQKQEDEKIIHSTDCSIM